MTPEFIVNVGIPGSLTIDVRRIPRGIQGEVVPNITAPLNRPVLSGGSAPDGLMSVAWGQNWANSVSSRLRALGGATPLQLVTFEAPSIDLTDNAWGMTADIDATSDPAIITGTPFGTSIYGREFAAGDYIIWDDPAVANGLYQYEIDLITALSQNTFTLQRRGKFSAAGRAQFNTVKAAHSGCNFYRMIDKTFFDLWGGKQQTFKFLWDNMIVSAVSLSMVGLDEPSLVSLIPVPPDPASMGLQI
jgi:hypothetical protein